MRIAFVQDFLRMGGTEQQTVQLANACAAAGHEVMLLTARPGGPLAARVATNVQRVHLQARDWHLDWFAPGLTRALRAFDPQIVQVMGRVAHMWGARLPRSLPRVRLVATFRTGRAIPYLNRLTLRRAHAVVANSKEAAQRLARVYGVTGSHVHVIRNALAMPPTMPDETRAQVRREFGVEENVVVLLCVAMMRRNKGHRELVRLAALLPADASWEMWLAGDGEERPGCEALARRLGVQDRVRFLGMRTDTHRLYAAADLAVLASRRESLPNFLVEAQWLGLPVVATEMAGVGETFAPGESGYLLPAGDLAGMRDAIGRLATDRDLRERMSTAARAYALREFDPVRQNQRYLELFRELERSRM